MLLYFTSTFYLTFLLLILWPVLFIENSLINNMIIISSFLLWSYESLQNWILDHYSLEIGSGILLQFLQHIITRRGCWAGPGPPVLLLPSARRNRAGLRGRSAPAVHDSRSRHASGVRQCFVTMSVKILGRCVHSRTPLLTHNRLLLEESIYKCLHSQISFITSSHSKDILHNYPNSRWIQVAYLKYTIRSIV